ncbi:unnamed protein product, partial [Didymodactylos carnosus]
LPKQSQEKDHGYYFYDEYKIYENKSGDCSFDNILACQYIQNRTFLYIMAGRFGFGSEMNQLLIGFAYSVATKRRFLIDSRHWNYGRFEDYFQLIRSKFILDEWKNHTLKFLEEYDTENDHVPHLKTTREGAQVVKFWRAGGNIDRIRVKQKETPIMSITIKRKVAHYLWRYMTRETYETIKSSISNAGMLDYFNSNKLFYACHIRKGDKLRKEASDIPLNRYIQAIERLAKNQGMNITNFSVFVAGDNQELVHNLKELKPQWTFLSFHYQNSTKLGHFQDKFN